MSKQWFDISDSDFFHFLKKLNEGFEESGVPYMFSGGVAHQIHTSSLLSEKHKKSLVDLFHTGDIDLYRFLRRTDNVDIAFGLPQGDGEYLAQQTSLKAAEKELKERNERSRTFYRKKTWLSRTEEEQLKLVDRHLKEGLREIEDKRAVLEEELAYIRDRKIKEIFDGLAYVEVENSKEDYILTIKCGRSGSNKFRFTLGRFEEQAIERPISVKIYRKATDACGKGYMDFLNEGHYRDFLSRAQITGVTYADEVTSFRTMNINDLFITKLLLSPHNDYKTTHSADLTNLNACLSWVGKDFDYPYIESILCRQEMINGDPKEDWALGPVDPRVQELYEDFRGLVKAVSGEPI